LRKRAREHRESIAEEVISLLERDIPTAADLKEREQFYERMKTLRARKSVVSGIQQPVEEMLRQDRER
jgi:hypothetical protein